jgi:hypothetical protein
MRHILSTLRQFTIVQFACEIKGNLASNAFSRNFQNGDHWAFLFESFMPGDWQ